MRVQPGWTPSFARTRERPEAPGDDAPRTRKESTHRGRSASSEQKAWTGPNSPARPRRTCVCTSGSRLSGEFSGCAGRSARPLKKPTAPVETISRRIGKELGATGSPARMVEKKARKMVSGTNGTLKGQSDSQPFALSVARAAGGVEATPSLDSHSPVCPSTFSLLKAVAIHSHSPRAAFGLRSEPAPDLIRGRTGVK